MRCVPCPPSPLDWLGALSPSTMLGTLSLPNGLVETAQRAQQGPATLSPHIARDLSNGRRRTTRTSNILLRPVRQAQGYGGQLDRPTSSDGAHPHRSWSIPRFQVFCLRGWPLDKTGSPHWRGEPVVVSRAVLHFPRKRFSASAELNRDHDRDDP
jgi:hypothetical protein